MSTDFTSRPLVHSISGTDDVVVERHTYATDLPFSIYRPPGGASTAILIVNGLPDPGVTKMLGKPLAEWRGYQDWARLIAASGVAAITYENRTPDDVFALVDHLRARFTRLGVFACSGHGPMGLAAFARAELAFAAIVYGYLLDLDGATHVKDAAKQFHFATPTPPLALDDLPRDKPLLIVRAGKDTTPGLDESMQRFLDRTRDRSIDLLEHAEAPHAFDLVDDSPRTHAVIDETLAWISRRA